MARGPAPEDAELFGASALPRLRQATHELSWLLDRGYAAGSALELVGNRHDLRARQRTAVLRCACTRAQAERRRDARCPPERVAGQALAIDGFNVIIAVESAFAGGVLLRGRDGVVRDLASVHGSYRRGDQTLAACAAIGERIAAWAPSSVHWWLDSPVSNSGRLRATLLELAAQRGWAWAVTLDCNPDRQLAAADGVIASADAWILDHASACIDLAAAVITAACPSAWIVDLGQDRAQVV